MRVDRRRRQRANLAIAVPGLVVKKVIREKSPIRTSVPKSTSLIA
jgi:hypothetical protein